MCVCGVFVLVCGGVCGVCAVFVVCVCVCMCVFGVGWVACEVRCVSTVVCVVFVICVCVVCVYVCGVVCEMCVVCGGGVFV